MKKLTLTMHLIVGGKFVLICETRVMSTVVILVFEFSV